MQGTSTQTSAPGKLILLGEYAVLEYAPCLVSAVERQCTIEIQSKDSEKFRIESSRDTVPAATFTLTDAGEFEFETDLSDEDFKRLRFVIWTLKHAIQNLNCSISAAGITINSDSFFHEPSAQKLGLGASAAITVSLLDALTTYSGNELAKDELYREAYHIHRKAQGGLGSGMDIAASSTGGVIKYQLQKGNDKEGIIKPVQWPSRLQMISIWAGRSASTQNMVQQVKHYQANHPAQFDSVMNPMKKLSEAGCRAFHDDDAEAFIDVVRDFTGQEQKLGEASGANIISDAHREIGRLVKNAGGIYKPSGAGGGDIGVAFCSNRQDLERIKAAVNDSKFDILDLPLQTSQGAAV